MSDQASWQRIKEVFQAALEHPPEARDAFVREACAGDNELLAEVRSLLAEDLDTTPWLDQPVYAAAAEMLLDDPEGAFAGQRIGPYQLLRELGRGGMGTVYLAERADGAYTQDVAIKLVQPDFLSGEMVNRFLQERQILARLEHPGIARLLDGGVTEGGRPYLVMEAIDGEPVDLYCESQSLGLRERIELFSQACNAVQYAHQRLVVHCDLKPSNLLVTAEGAPKLLDFGVAKLLGSGPGSGSAATVAWGRRLTPDYASPEQLRGEPVSTSSDVYALGVLLYRLLTGRVPFELAGKSWLEVERALEEERPAAPSMVLGRSTRWGRQLAGDLDTIVLRAMAKEPSRRYGSVEQLAEDLRRYLVGLPVLARRDTFVYRSAKFVRRHVWGVAAALLIVASLVAGIATTSWQARQAEVAREREEIERRRAEETAGFLEGLFRELDPSRTQNPDLTVREFLNEAVQRVSKETRDQPLLQASLLRIIGEGYRELSLYDRAREYLEQAALIVRQEAGNEHPDLAACLDALGVVALDQGELSEAEGLVVQALRLREQFFGQRSLPVAESMNSLGLVQRAMGKTREGAELFRQALEIRRSEGGDQDREISVSLNNLGEALDFLEEDAEALALHSEALDLRRHLYGERHLLVANSLNNLGSVLADLGESEAAEERYREALELYRQLDHSLAANAMHNLAELLSGKEGGIAEAKALAAESIQIHQRVNAPVDEAAGYMLLGVMEAGDGRLAEAEDAITKAHSLQLRFLGIDHADFVDSLFSLAVVRRLRGTLAAMAPELQQVLQSWRSSPPAKEWQPAYLELLLAEALARGERCAEAQSWIESSEPVLRDSGREDLAEAVVAVKALCAGG